MSDPPRAAGLRIIRDHAVLASRTLTGTLTVGRSPDNDLVLDDEKVSGHHGQLSPDGAHWRYTDVGSTNGSTIAGGPVLRAGQSCLLREDSQILLGNTVLELRLGEAEPRDAARDGASADVGAPGALDTHPVGEPGHAEGQAAPLGPGPGAGALADGSGNAASGTASQGAAAGGPPPGQPRLIVVLHGRATSVPLRADVAVIGRGAGCDVRIDDASISALHARLALQDGRWMLTDLSSTNGTRLGLRRVVGAEEVRNGDHIIIGAADVLFVLDDTPAPGERAVRRALDERALALAQRDGRLTSVQARAAGAVLAAGSPPLGEYLVTQGWLSPGGWVELRTEAQAPDTTRDIRAATRRRRRVVVTLVVVAVLLVATWLVISAVAP